MTSPGVDRSDQIAACVTSNAAAIMSRMLDEYERGARFERQDARDVLLRIDEDTFPAAFAPDGREAHQTLSEDVSALYSVGAIRLVRERLRGGGERVELRLGSAEVPLAYAVAMAHGYQPLRASLDALKHLIEELLSAAETGVQAPVWWRTYLAAGLQGARTADLRTLGITARARLKTEWPEVRDALIAADRLSRTVDTWARHFSEGLFADSKRLTAIKARTAGILRMADPRWTTDGAETPDPEDVLSAYGIRRRPPTITCAGAFPVHRSDTAGGPTREYHLADFEPVAVLPSTWGPDLAAGAVAACVRTVTIIENEYPLFSYIEEAGGPSGLGARGELVIWSSGFVADHLLDLLARIAAEGGDAVLFRHWGDADPAGLAIWWQIRTRLGRPVILFRSTAEWVVQAAAREGQSLSEAERRQLIAQVARFRASEEKLRSWGAQPDLTMAASMAETLLRLGIKLEQERQ